MDTKKYIDMAFLNERGREWYAKIFEKNTWDKWKEVVRRSAFCPRQTPEETEVLAKRILFATVWMLGFVQSSISNKSQENFYYTLYGSKNNPRSSKGFFASGKSKFAYPLEIAALDDFLEHLEG